MFYKTVLKLCLSTFLLVLPALGYAKDKKSHNHSSSKSHRKNHYHPKTLPGTWTPLSNSGEFGTGSEFPAAWAPLLLTDGSVLVNNLSSPNLGQMWKLTPDIYGSYENGTWSQVASLPTGYAPLYYASAVLADGRVIMIGGEYNGPEYSKDFTAMGAIYDPVADVWDRVAPPLFFPADVLSPGINIGDPASVVLEDGTFMLQSPLSRQAALWNPKKSHMPTWVETGTATKFDGNLEEGWTLLPNGKVLTVDCYIDIPQYLAVVTTDQPGLGPFAYDLTVMTPVPISPLTAIGAAADPIGACSPLNNDLTGKIGLVQFTGVCGSVAMTTNSQNAGSVATIIINSPTPVQFTGISTQINVVISADDGAMLLAALEQNPNIQITINEPLPNPDFQNKNSEVYNPKNGTWSSAGSTIAQLTDTISFEMGPQVLRPDGTVFVVGANGNTSNYHVAKNRWIPGPSLPFGPGEEGQLGAQDGPGALLPNGNVLFCAAPIDPIFSPPVHYFEFDGTKIVEQATAPFINAPYLTSYNISMLVLPTGQILAANQFTSDVLLYTAGDTSYNPDWAPVISRAPKKVQSGKSYKIEGIRFNGMSQAGMYGDDYQSASNYPLVRITNCKTGHVFYCRTHDHSYMGVASDKKVHTHFDVPAHIELGKSKLEVVANGIPSKPMCIVVKR